MRLKRVEMEGIRGLPSVRLELGKGGTCWITGAAGVGKTTVLEAIMTAIDALSPGAITPDASAWRREGTKDARVELGWELDALEQTVAGAETFSAAWRPGGPPSVVPGRMRDLIAASRVHYFDAHRLSAPGSPFEAVHAPARMPRPPCWRPSSRKYDWIERWLLARFDARAATVTDRLDERGIAIAQPDESPFARAMRALAPHAHAGRPVVREGKRLAGFVRPDGERPSFAELTMAERMGVLFAAVFDAGELAGALVLVDAPELGIHPADHTSFVGALAQLVGPGTLVAATTSAPILRAAPRDTVTTLG